MASWPLDCLQSCHPLSFGVLLGLALLLIALLDCYDIINRPTFQPPEACKRLGLIDKSGLADEFEKTYDGDEQKASGHGWRVKSLWSYPVKSCRGIEFDRNMVTSLGMKYDRVFTLAIRLPPSALKDKQKNAAWKFITQRQIPALTTVRTEICAPDPDSPSYDPQHRNVLSDGVVVIKWPGPNTVWYKPWRRWLPQYWSYVVFPYDPTDDQISQSGYTAENVTVWKDSPNALLLACSQDESNRSYWLKDLKAYLQFESKRQNPDYKASNLNHPLALFRLSNKQPREVYRNAPKREEAGYQPITGFQDAYPLQILNLASVRDIASKLPPDVPPLSARNYRSNIVIAGGEAYTEDDWKLANIGGHKYYITSRTSRCPMPNVNQDTGKKNKQEPYSTMYSFRRIDEGCKLNSCLGMHVVPGVEHEVEMKVGDTIDVLETGEHLYIKQ